MRQRVSTIFYVAVIGVAVVVGLVAAALSATVFDPSTVKQAIRQSDAYSSVAPDLLDTYRDITVAGITGRDPAVRLAAEQTFTADYVAGKAEPAIDNTFGWLEGTVTKPDFSIDYRDGQTAFYARVANNLGDRAAALPACDLRELLALGTANSGVRSLDDIDLTKLTCLPPGVERAGIVTAIRGYLSRSQASLSSTATTFNASDVRVGGVPFYENGLLRHLPTMHRAVSWAPWIGLLLVLTCGVLLYRGGALRFKGISLAVALAVSGLLCGVLAFGLQPLARSVLDRMGDGAGPIAISVAISLAGSAGDWLKIAAIVPLLAGIVLFAMIAAGRRRRPDTKIPG